MNITGKTKIVGVIGDPVQHSRSPQMQNAAIAELGIDFVYVPFHVKSDQIREAIDGFKALNVVGINVTIPHKQIIIPFIDEISHEAKLIGAINTLTFENGKMHGDNTDARGFLRAMHDEIGTLDQKRSAVVLGAGGASRAIVVALTVAQFDKITIANRTETKAKNLANDLDPKVESKIEAISIKNVDIFSQIVKSADLIVNCTSIGMHGDELPLISANWISERSIVYDIVYTPPETPLLKCARSKGCRTIGGLGMLVHQGAIALERWTGRSPNVCTMRFALEAALK